MKTVIKLETEIDATNNLNHNQLLIEISNLIENGRQKVAREFNSTLILLNWLIGSRINQAILGDIRAEYGEQVINRLAQQLTSKYGKGYSRPSLFRMVRFAKLFPEKEIVSTLSRQLSWSHLLLFCTIARYSSHSEFFFCQTNEMKCGDL